MIAYFITCNNNADFLKFLVAAIYRKKDLFLIHCDIKSPVLLQNTVRSLAAVNKNIKLLDSRDYAWAGFSQVETVLDAISYALRLGGNWNHFITLSEQHLPTMSALSLSRMIESKGSFVGVRPVKSMADSEKIDVRNRSSLFYEELPGVGSFSKGINDPKEDFIDSLYHGSNWYILSRKHCEHLFSEKNLRKILYFRHTIHADENALQSVLWSEESQQVDSIENIDTTFVAWPNVTDNDRLIFSEDNFWYAVANKIPFIRKRPLDLPMNVGEYIKKFGSDQIRDEFFKESFISAIKVNISNYLLEADRGYIPDYAETIAGLPAFFVKITHNDHPEIGVYIISENLYDFKILLSKKNSFDGYFLPFVIGEREVSLIRARVYDLIFQKDISVPEASNYGFFSMQNIADCCIMLNLIDIYTRAASEVHRCGLY